MAGEWLKMELSTPDKPEVLRMSRILGMDKDTVLGKLLRVWAWFDKNTVDGHVDGVTSADVDGIALHNGFTSAMQLVGWFDFDDEAQWVTLTNFDRHNGETAKQRALKNKRQGKWRANVDASPSTEASTESSVKTSTREEKRREETNTPAKAGFCFKTELLTLGVPADIADDWLKVRKAKKATNTKTAFSSFLREVEKSGWGVTDAVSHCAEKDWKGFTAEWVKNINPAQDAKPLIDTSIEAKRDGLQRMADHDYETRSWMPGERPYHTVITIENGAIKRTKNYDQEVAA